MLFLDCVCALRGEQWHKECGEKIICNTLHSRRLNNCCLMRESQLCCTVSVCCQKEGNRVRWEFVKSCFICFVSLIMATLWRTRRQPSLPCWTVNMAAAAEPQHDHVSADESWRSISGSIIAETNGALLRPHYRTHWCSAVEDCGNQWRHVAPLLARVCGLMLPFNWCRRGSGCPSLTHWVLSMWHHDHCCSDGWLMSAPLLVWFISTVCVRTSVKAQFFLYCRSRLSSEAACAYCCRPLYLLPSALIGALSSCCYCDWLSWEGSWPSRWVCSQCLMCHSSTYRCLEVAFFTNR